MAYTVKENIDDQSLAAEIKQLAEGIVMPAQADTAGGATLATLIADFNALLAKLRAAGLMTP